jgi:hypothetical protein
MGYLPEIYGKEQIDGALTNTVTALGLVGLGNTRKSSNTLIAAHTAYVKALSDINAKLRNAQAAKSDQVLVTVMLLGMYEVRHLSTCSCPD